MNGAPRITADLRDDGEVVSTKTVAKLMHPDGLQGISPRPRRPVTTLADQVPHTIPDRVGRAFDRGALNVVVWHPHSPTPPRRSHMVLGGHPRPPDTLRATTACHLGISSS
ncbi:IS3 family transposase [Ornithinimicrobium sediminis]|uniref:IS3 family transposase n=1 Tax=Ornithinimicrobium sediminis TaxID=2904603 RepID=UPI0038CDC692